MKPLYNQQEQNELAEKFYALHRAAKMLVIPNAWDCASAKIFEEAGFPAIATTSSGISWACGYQDGEHIPPQLMAEVVGRIARVVSIPVTADIEGGYYRHDLDKLTAFIQTIMEAGAVGVNLEDTDAATGKPCAVKEQEALIAAVRKTADKSKINLYINARVDAMELPNTDLATKIQTCIDRAAAYKEAGASGIFVPFVADIKTVAQLKEKIELPLNILMSNTLSVAKLREIGVNRISVGGKPMLAGLSRASLIAKDLLAGDDWSSLFVQEPNYPMVNNWFK